MRRSIRLPATTIALLILAPACESPPLLGSLRGALSTTVTTTGGDLDLDGYTIALDGGASQPIPTNGFFTFRDLSTGEHTVELSQWAANCLPAGSAQRTSVVRGGATVEVVFTVNCAASGVRATITTGGSSPDINGYTLRVDGMAPVPAPNNGSAMVTRLALGSHVVELGGVEPNCAATGGNSRAVSLATYEVAEIQFDLTCTALYGLVSVTTVTSGTLLDPNGYGVRIGTAGPMPIGLNGALVSGHLSAGSYDVRLEGVAANCAVAEPNPSTVQVVTGGVVPDTARVVFHVTCESDRGSLRVTTATTGADIPTNYLVFLDDDYYYYPRSIGVNDTLTFTDVTEGVHNVVLRVPANCVIAGGGFRQATVVRNTIVDIAFEVHCSELGRIELIVATTGVDLDPDGYLVNVAYRDLNLSNGVVILTGVYPGVYPVTVYGVTPNCDVTVSPAQVTVVLATTTTVTVNVACATAATIAIARLGDLYTVKANGTAITILTSTAGTDDAPSWSPDGSRIAFRSDRNGHAEIYVMDAGGQNPARLTTGTAASYQPDWSPDGARIAFVSERDGNPEIYVMNADGSGVVRLTNDAAADRDPDWSPDGNTIAFSSERGGQSGIYVVSPAGGNATPLFTRARTDGVGEPAWSPDGARIAFSRIGCDYYYGCTRDLWVMQADGTGAVPLAAGGYDRMSPAWSPDGRWVAFSASLHGLGTVRSDGTDARVVLPSGGALTPAWRP